ncbi:MAG: hypothetical protein Salg2KO_05250 [Salibacteraceae bacterium]
MMEGLFHISRTYLLVIFVLTATASVQAQTKVIEKSSNGKDASEVDVEYGKALLSPSGNSIYFVKSYDFSVKQGRVSQSVWKADWQDNNALKNVTLLDGINNYYNNGVVGISNDGRRLYLLGTYANKDRLWPGISVVEQVQSGWTNPKPLSVKKLHIKSELFDFFVTPDETAMFIAMGTTQYGQIDLYLSERQADKTWSEPIKLDSINTDSSNEISPFYSEEYGALFFSSDRKGGMGSFDIYMVPKGETWFDWQPMVRLPRPYNSALFDAYFTAYEKHGAFLVSNRKDSLSKLYHFRSFDTDFSPPTPRTRKNREFDTEIAYALVSGRFLYDKIPIAGVEILLLNRGGTIINKTLTDDRGNYRFEGLSPDQNYLTMYADPNHEYNSRLANLNEYNDVKVSQATTNVEGVFRYDSLPKSNVLIVLFDNNEQVIDHTYTNKLGFYAFEELTADRFYTAKYTDKEDLLDPTHANLEEVEYGDLPPNFVSIHRVKERDVAELDVDRFLIENQGDIPKEAKAYLKDKITNTTETASIREDGTFEFNRMERADDYELSFSEDLEGEKLEVYNVFENARQSMEMSEDGFIAIKPVMLYPDIELDFDRFTLEYEGEVPANSKAYLREKSTNKTEEADIESDGSFKFPRMKEAEDYELSFSKYLEPEKIKVYSVTSKETKPIQFNDEGFAAIKPEMHHPDIELDMDRFTVEYDGDIPKNSKAYLREMSTNKTEEANIETDGTFSFPRMKEAEDYELSFSEYLEPEKMRVYSAPPSSKQEIKINTEGFAAVKPEMFHPDIELDFDRFTLDYDGDIPTNSKAYLREVSTNKTEVADIAPDGTFKFPRMKEAEDYELSFSEYLEPEKIKVYSATSENSNEIVVSDQGFAAIKPEMFHPDIELDFDRFTLEYEGGVPANSKAYLREKSTNKTEEADIASDGSFKFPRMKEAEDYELSFSEYLEPQKMKVYSAPPASKQEIKIDMEGFAAVKPEMFHPDIELDFDRFTVDYEGPIPSSAKAYLREKSTNKTETSEIGLDGTFSFPRMKEAEDYELTFSENMEPAKMKVYSGVDEGKQEIAITDKGFAAIKPVMYHPDIDLDFDRFAVDYDGEIPVNAMAYLREKSTNHTESANIETDGSFKFPRMNEAEDYELSFSEDMEPTKMKVYSTSSYERKVIEISDKGFAAIKPEMYHPDIELDFDRFLVDYEGDLPTDAQAYLKEVSTSNTETVNIEKDGSFQFDKMNRADDYELSFSENMDPSKMKLYNVYEDRKQPMDLSEEGFVAVKPVMLYPDIELDVSRFAQAGHKKRSFHQSPKAMEAGPSFTPPSATGNVVLTLNFAFNEIIPDGSSTIRLDNTILRDKSRTLELHGYTDNIGTKSINQRVSEQRADQVKRYLVRNGYPTGKLTTVGHGDNHPLSPNDSEAGRAANRRVEIRLK